MDIAIAIITIALIIMDKLMISALVGIAFFIVFARREKFLLSIKAFYALMIIFILYDYYTLPAIMVADATILIGNSRIADLIGGDRIDVLELMGAGWLDIIIWMIQALVAYRVGGKVYRRYIANKTPACL